MPSDRSESSRPSWRGGAKPAPRAAKPGAEWTKRRERSAERTRRPGGRAYKIASAALGFLGCLVLLIALIILLRPPAPVAVVLVGADYATNLSVPQNTLGWQGLKDVETLLKRPRRRAWFNPASLHLLRDAATLEDRKGWDELVDDLKKSRFDEKTLVLIAALHGGADERGAYLLPNQAARPEDRLLLSDLIDSLAKLPPEKQKVLVLEAAQPAADWRQGMVTNEFARQLKKLESKIRGVANLWILSACDVDQQCWSSEGLGRTVFIHYLIEALRGQGPGGGRSLSLEGLHGYLRQTVASWVWATRGAVQEPVLLPGPAPAAESDAAAAKRTTARKVALATVPGTPRPEPAAAFDRTGPKAAWRRFRELDRLVPHPSTYTPRQWSEYRARLVRYEELARAGASERTGALSDRLRTLEARLQSERFLKRLSSSAENSLVMNAVQGGRTDPWPFQGFEAFWNAPAAPEVSKAWQKLAASRPPGGDGPGRSLRSSAAEFLLDRAAGNPSSALARAAGRVDVIRGNEYPLPAELHYLRMLSGFLGGSPDRPADSPFWKIVSQALTVRREAERTALGVADEPTDYPYCEEVHPWIAPLIAAADVERRRGEDRLFSSEEPDWTEASRSLTKAGTAYREAAERAATVRDALAVRDRALANLPEYAGWLPHRPADEMDDELPGRLEELCGQAHELERVLEQPDADAVPKLKQLTATLEQGLHELSTRFETQRSRIDSTRSRDDWELDRAAAAVAFADSEDLTLRTTLWNRLDNIRKNDYAVYARGEKGGPSAEDRKLAGERLHRRARLEGRMALAVLGERWFDDRAVFTNLERGDLKSVAAQVGRPLPGDDDEVPEWSKDMVEAGTLIGQRWRQLAPEMDKLAEARSSASGDLPEYEAKVARAERLSRLVDGAAPGLGESDVEPARQGREARVHDLIVWLAERSRLDHWFGEDGKKPYYQVVGAGYLDDAGALLPETPLARAERERINLPDELRLQGPPALVLTSERTLPAAVNVVKSAALPEGIPVIKPTAGSLLHLLGESTGYRAALLTSGTESIRLTLAPAPGEGPGAGREPIKPGAVSSSLRVDGYFRGRTFASTTEVAIHPVPEVVAAGPGPIQPPQASLAVRADSAVIGRYGEGTGALAIVLDCSGSMIPGDPSSLVEANASPDSKFQQAKRALARVLALVPKGTAVSIWIFGQARQGFTSLSQQSQVDVQNGLQPEQTIRQFLAPSPWDPANLDALVRRLDEIWPLYGTPLLQAMWGAKSDLDKAKGLKTLLVLTDGNDNRFMANRSFNREGITIPQFIQKYFSNTGIAINMIFFRVEPRELEEAKRNFQGIAELSPPGQFFPVEKFGELVAILERSIKQKLRCEILRNGVPVEGSPVDVTNPDEADRWLAQGLEPGQYLLRVRADRPYTREVEVARGDRLLVRLVEGKDGGLAFDRASYSADVDGAVSRESGGSRVSVLSSTCRDDQGTGMTLLADLEPLGDRGPRLAQVEPRFAWFDLAAKDAAGEPEFAVRWRRRPFYPAAVWQFDVGRWRPDPGGLGLARPVLKTFWFDREAEPVVAATVDLSGVATPEAFQPHQVALTDRKSVVVESFRLEDHMVESRPGDSPVSEHCLVVRIDYAGEGAPVLVEPESLRQNGIEVSGYEHRVYTRARKYAGLFWPVTREQFKNLKGVSVMSLSQLGREAAQQQHAVEIELNAPPQVGGRPPAPPDALNLPN